MSNEARVLDVRSLPPTRRHPEIFGAFDALGPGQSFVLVSNHNLKPVLRELQAERPGRFDCNVLEAGPERFRIEIRRRTSEAAPSVTEHLQADHRRLDALLAEVERLSLEHAVAEARTRLAEFVFGLERHMDVEEEVLFPAFEKWTGRATGPTGVMRSEHQEIRERLERIRTALREADLKGAHEAICSLLVMLSDHNLKEERMLYLMTDRAAGSDGERHDLVHRLQTH